MKKFFFMSGLPRSGSTLLSSILNQNENIRVSANSILPDVLDSLLILKETNLKFKNFKDEKSFDNLIISSFDSYYKNWNCNYVIDKSFVWGFPKFLNVISKIFDYDIKIICTVRDVLEVLVSYYNITKNKSTNDILTSINDGLRIPSYCSSIDEYIFDSMMDSKLGNVEQALYSVKNLCSEEHKNKVLFVEYEDLVNKTGDVINSIYDFLDIKHYEHNLNFIEQFSVNGIMYDDMCIDMPNLHTLKHTIEYSKKDLSILPTKVIHRYSNLEFWRNLK